MDPVSAIGIASAIVQFLDVGFKIASRLAEYNKTGPNEAPGALRAISIQLPLLLDALDRIKSEDNISRFDTNTRCILRGVVGGCSSLTNDIDTLLIKVAKQEGESVTVRLKKAFGSLKYEEKVKEIDRSLRTYIQVLVLHQVVDTKVISTGVSEDTEYFDVREKVAESFVTRTDILDKLDEAFYRTTLSQATRPTLVALTGENGVGKSQAALEYCHQARKSKQFQTIFWLNAESPHLLALSLESAACIVRHSLSGSRNEKLQFLKKFLTDRWHPWLIVLDNYSHNHFENENVQLTSMLPSAGHGAILITSRNPTSFLVEQSITVNKFITGAERKHFQIELHGAVERPDIERVRSIVASGYDVNNSNLIGWSFLTRASLMCFTEAVRLFLSKGANIDPNPHMKSPLEWAANEGSLPTVEVLLDHEDSSSIRLKSERYEGAVQEALENAHLEVVKTLLKRRGVKMTMTGSHGRSIFVKAARDGKPNMLRFFFENQLDPKDDLEKGEALCQAIGNGHLHIVKFLIQDKGFSPNLFDKEGQTPIYHAANIHQASYISAFAEKGNMDVEYVRFLLDVGADPNLRGPNSRAALPLHGAAIMGRKATIKMLIEAGADVTDTGHGLPAVQSAMRVEPPTLLPELLSVRIEEAEKRKAYFNSTLQFGAQRGARDLMLAVLKEAKPGADVDINQQDHRGKTPLLKAIYEGQEPAARLLLRYGADQTIPSYDEQLPLLLAADKGLESVVRTLLNAKDSTGPEGTRDKEGNTALHVAFAKGHQRVINVLLNAGADRNVTNDYGDSPLDVAKDVECTEDKRSDKTKFSEEWGGFSDF